MSSIKKDKVKGGFKSYKWIELLPDKESGQKNCAPRCGYLNSIDNE
ncbi:TPA: hypothetical protein ACSTOR_000554 [Staphylococcus aureus]